MAQAIYKVAIIGGGAMGQGIASLIAQQGIPVVIKEMNDDLAEKALKKITRKIDQAVERGKIMSDSADMAKDLISATADYEEMSDADLVIEAVFEEMKIKKAVFADLDERLPEHVIFATNTSSLSISEMAEATKRPDKIVGVHFFNPPITMPLVELISGTKTSEDTLVSVEDFSKDSLGKITIRVKECPGFLVNRLLMPYLNEATLLLSETNLTVEEIDEKAKDFDWPMGPFTLIDYLGVDIASEVAKILSAGYGERAKAAPLMEIMVKLDRRGAKSGAGFYVDDESKGFEDVSVIIDREFPDRDDLSVDIGFNRMMCGMVNEAFLCLEEEISTADEIETGCKYGIGFPFALGGPLHWAESVGLDKILDDLQSYEVTYGSRFMPSSLLADYAAQGKALFEEESW